MLTIKIQRNDMAFPLKGIFWVHLSWDQDKIRLLYCVIILWIFHPSCFGPWGALPEDHVMPTSAYNVLLSRLRISNFMLPTHFLPGLVLVNRLSAVYTKKNPQVMNQAHYSLCKLTEHLSEINHHMRKCTIAGNAQFGHKTKARSTWHPLYVYVCY